MNFGNFSIRVSSNRYPIFWYLNTYIKYEC
nr:MAG TPA: hypothetical protein [Crassvirales sp.]